MKFDYDLIVIGAGSGGLSAVAFARALNQRTALIEKHRVGGDCTWTGCVPSKALLKAAQIAHHARIGATYGVVNDAPTVNMAHVRGYIQSVIQQIYQHETPDVLRQDGTDVFLGGARFIDAHTIRVGDKSLTGARFVLATGAHPRVPEIPGLHSVPFHTYETIFDNDRLPEHLIVIGAGPVGCEIAQAYRRFGARVTLIGEHLLARDEPEAVERISHTFKWEGIDVITGRVTSAHKLQDDIVISAHNREIRGAMLLIAAGRSPNVSGLGLENAGITYSERGILVDAYLRTSQPHIYAIGDCTGGHQFTHYAGWQGFKAVRNAVLPLNSRGVREHIPYTTFTDPAVARAGLTEREARDRFGDRIRVTYREGGRIDRAITDDAPGSLIKLVTKRNGTLLGATVIAPDAGEIITEYALALELKLKPTQLAQTIHVYPTFATGSQLALADVTQAALFDSMLGKALMGLSARMRRAERTGR
jgi:pyruvate/2-oxoglutarate dehydrogenase complex dihydrolipoamide dehydrogenase (E3) component